MDHELVVTSPVGVESCAGIHRVYVNVHAFDVSTGEELWRTRLGTSVQGFPVAFSAGGEQYIAVSTGLGGGSPRNVVRAITPEIRQPNSGNALYVFKLKSR